MGVCDEACINPRPFTTGAPSFGHAPHIGDPMALMDPKWVLD
jgi:hypothetical protein